MGVSRLQKLLNLLESGWSVLVLRRDLTVDHFSLTMTHVYLSLRRRIQRCDAQGRGQADYRCGPQPPRAAARHHPQGPSA